MKPNAYKVAIIAGEDSGDLLGAELIKGLKNINQHIEYVGVGGRKMREQGMQMICDNKEFAIMGIAEVLKKLPKLLRLRRQIVRDIIAQKPDVFIGIDAPDLNFPIEKKLKKLGIKIIHYVSPSIWAWRPKRAHSISQLTDLVLTLFPFEPDYYNKIGGSAQFVGHPLAENISMHIDKKAAKKQLGLTVDQPVLAVLPGSRTNELRSHTDVFIKAALRLQQDHPELCIISANTSDEKNKFIQECANRNQLKITMYKDATQVLKAADITLLASGTVALEAMLCKTPMVVAYKISAVTYAIVKGLNLMLLPYYSLPNVIYGDFLVPEVLQKDMTTDNLYQALKPLLSPVKQLKLQQQFTRLHQDLLSPDLNAAQAVNEFIQS